VLELKNVSAGYGPLQILWGISLKVDTGEFVSLVGRMVLEKLHV